MEYIWYVIAALGAGIGTGLAGLSAATIMVPILIVLCPSFAGEAGVYQATAIALASDILGSAVTTWIYIKHKNIDLKRGWIMMACILSMCVVGSFAAWLAGNVILGGFSLFLTFFIGVRFLVKPDTQRKDVASKGEKLDFKGVLISLFFGLTIGFGTGFVGTGGGMMMLIVFTSFLGMELKTAVGTSTFIMTFTALIASVSHILIEPSIVMERWDVLIICIVVATLSSLISAQFANKVKSRTVGLATGIVLTVMGAAMIVLNYWDWISNCELLMQVLKCCGEFLEYIGFGALVLIMLHFTMRMPKYVFRKLLHLVAFTSVIEMILVAENWMSASITALLFALLVYPILKLFEDRPWFSGLFVQKKDGEVKLSLLLLFFTAAAVIAFTWGLAGKRHIAIAAILMWGVGDAAAALVGTKFGKHKVKMSLADGKKTWEGSLAMFITAFVCGALSLLLLSDMRWYQCLAMTLPSAAVAAFAELVSRNGNDTVIVPVAVTLTLSLISVLV